MSCVQECCIRKLLAGIVAGMSVSTPEQWTALEEEVAGMAESADAATEETMRVLTESIERQHRR